MDNGHKFVCFHNLDIDVINAETKALHHSVHLFFESAEVKAKLYSLLQKIAMVIDQTHLKMGKLSYSSNQKNANNRRPLDEDPDVEHGFVDFLNFFSFEKDQEK